TRVGHCGNRATMLKSLDARLLTASRSQDTVTPRRHQALDGTKGLLFLFMVLYHWLNYFVSRDGDFYKYLRFVTPSFIFITGFLITNVYLRRYRLGSVDLHTRLLVRGLKLI